MLTQEQKEHHVKVCWDILNQCQAKGDRCDVTAICQIQHGSAWSGVIQILQRRKSSRQSPQQVKYALSFGIGKRAILLDVLKLWPLHHNAV